MNRCSLVALAGTALIAAASAQQTFVVDASGGGQFTDIPPALAVAEPGDTVLVRPGIYSSFTVEEGIRLLGDPGATAGNPFVGFDVRRLPAGQTLVVRGLSPDTSLVAGRIIVDGNLGHVHLEDIEAGGGLTVRASAQVSVHALTIGGSAPAALDVTGSKVLVTESQIAAFASLGSAPGVLCIDSHVILAESDCAGTRSIRSPSPGAHLSSGVLTIAGDAGTSIAAGSPFGLLPAVSAIVVEDGTLVLDPAVELLPTGGAEPIRQTGGTVVRTRVASMTASVVAQQLTVRLRGAESSFVALLAGPPLRPSVSTPFGELWIGPVHAVLDSGLAGDTGLRTAVVGLGPVPPGAEVALQWIVLRPTTIELSTPLVRTLDG